MIIYWSHFFCLHFVLQSVELACVGVQECSCEFLNDQSIINCKSLQLARVPSFSYNAAQFSELTLANNQITEIPRSAFSGLYVNIIDLSGNKLKTLDSLSFYGVEKSLIKLIIELDSSAIFPAASFDGLSNLESLNVIGFGGIKLPYDSLKSIPQLKELSITNGKLTSLSSSEVKNMFNIKNLFLNDNEIEIFPTEIFINSLTGVINLNMANNKISQLRPGNLIGAIETIDLSGNILEGNIHPDAFLQLDKHLKYLKLQSCLLDNVVLYAISKVTSLISLQLQYNRITQLPSNIFKNLSSLQILNLAYNKINQISKESFNGLSKSVVSFYLQGNTNLRLASDVFYDFQSLKELNLNEIQGLVLSSESFSQSTQLEIFSIAKTNIGPSIYQVFKQMPLLKNLYLSSAGLSSLSDFMFKNNNRLQMIDFSNNTISIITQQSMFGLKTSLSQIIFNSNKITSIDSCVFYHFLNIDYTRLGLLNNPLSCDCKLKWLYDAAKEKNPAMFSALRWRCSDGRLFSQLTTSDFINCESFLLSCNETNPPSENTPSTPLLLTVSEITFDSALVDWTLQTNFKIYGFTIDLILSSTNRSETSIILSQQLRQFRLKNLLHDSQYIVCISVDISDNWLFPKQKCTKFTTLPSTNQALIGAIAGGIIGGILLLVVIIVLLVCLRRKCVHNTKFIKENNFVNNTNTLQQKQAIKTNVTPLKKTNLPASNKKSRDTINAVYSHSSFTNKEIDNILMTLTSTQVGPNNASETLSSHLSHSRPSISSYNSEFTVPTQSKRRKRRGEKNQAFGNDEIFSISKNIDSQSLPRNSFFEMAMDTEV